MNPMNKSSALCYKTGYPPKLCFRCGVLVTDVINTGDGAGDGKFLINPGDGAGDGKFLINPGDGAGDEEFLINPGNGVSDENCIYICVDCAKERETML